MATAGFEITDPQEPDGAVLCLLFLSSDFTEGLIVYFLLLSISIGTIIFETPPWDQESTNARTSANVRLEKETAVGGANWGSGLIIFESLSKRMLEQRRESHLMYLLVFTINCS